MSTEPRRGRPTKFNRDKAISEARKLFHARGYENVGVAELGKTMGIKPPSLYAAFGNKQRLYELALDEYESTVGEWIPEILGRTGAIEDVIGELFREAACRYTADEGCPGCLVLNSARVTTSPEICDLAKHRCAATRELIRKRIQADTSDPTESLTDYVMLVLHGLSAGASAGWSRAVVERAANSAALGFKHQVS